MITCWQTGNISSTAGWIFPFFGDFNFAGSLTNFKIDAGWDFYCLKVLLAGSEERVFFSQES